MPPRNTLELLVNEPTRITFGPYSIDVTPLTIGELPAVLRHMQPIIPVLDMIRSEADAFAMIGDYGDALIEVVALAARLPVDQVRALTPDLVLDMFLKIAEVNVDFFGPRLKPLIEKASSAKARIAAATSSTGQTPLHA